jgi:excisionase family DNA binding protein
MSDTKNNPAGGSGTHDGEQDTTRAAIAPLLLTIPEAARVLAIGRTTLYELISDGAIDTVRIGRATRISVEAVRAFVDRIQAGR